jgi:hypothetical protein
MSKPKNLYELAAKTFGVDPNGPEVSFYFNDDAAKINVDYAAEKDFRGEAKLMFRDGNYSFEGFEDVQKGMEIVGQQLLDQAKKEGIKITDLPEFANVDFDKNGKVTEKEVGALVFAASLNTYLGPFNPSNSAFDNDLSKFEMEAMLNPKHAETIKAVAKQLLQDNGVKVADPQTDQQFIQTLNDNGLPRARC